MNDSEGSVRAYRPLEPAKRPGRRPSTAPVYRVLIHKKFQNHWSELVTRVGLQQAQQFWDHVSSSPGSKSGTASITILKGKAGAPQQAGWSRTHHYEVSGAGRIDYQYHNQYKTAESTDEHKVVAILTIAFGSH